MKTCGYCGRENDEMASACCECGTLFGPDEPLAPSLTISRRTLVILGIVALVVTACLDIRALFPVLVIPLLAIFYAPIYGPFLISFAMRSHRWRGLRRSLRAASVLAFIVRWWGVSTCPDFGDDVAGNISGAFYNFVWTWGSGIACTAVALVVGRWPGASRSTEPRVALNGDSRVADEPPVS